MRILYFLGLILLWQSGASQPQIACFKLFDPYPASHNHPKDGEALGHQRRHAPDFSIGTKWVYEAVEMPLPVLTGYQSFEITDTTTFQGRHVFVIENDYDNHVEYMHVDGASIYFWDEPSGAFQLTYHFGSDSFYTAYWEGLCHAGSGEAVISIDSTSIYTNGQGTISVQHTGIQNSGTFSEDFHTSIYEGIGLTSGGLRLPLGRGLCDFGRYLSVLRCFENDSVSFNFAGYPCDTVFLSTSVTGIDEIIPVLYPNPTSGHMRIDGLDVETPYIVYDLQGHILQSGIMQQGEIRINGQGFYILKIRIGAKWAAYKVIVVHD